MVQDARSSANPAELAEAEWPYASIWAFASVVSLVLMAAGVVAGGEVGRSDLKMVGATVDAMTRTQKLCAAPPEGTRHESVFQAHLAETAH